MKYTAGFIGIGNMGGALVDAVCKTTDSKNIAIFDVCTLKAEEKAITTGAVNTSFEDVVSNSKYLFLGVKPNIIDKVASDIKKYLSNKTVIVSMAAGTCIDKISSALDSKRIIRIMPNTPVAAGEGMILYCTGETVTEEDLSGFTNLLEKAGVLDGIDEKLIDAASALSGCGPAFVYMFIEAVADGAVKCGLPRDKALLYAKQTVKGSACLALGSTKHPEQLKDEVCSPGGTTIEGVLALEKSSFRSSAASAVVSAYEKTLKL